MSGRRVAIIGGGIAGITAAWQLARLGADFTLFAASDRLGGTVETVHRDGFTIECGPDGWVTEKPWAAELAAELGLAEELIGSNDTERVTYILSGGALVPMPDGMRLMIPTRLDALEGSPLFSPAARAAYAAEPGRAEELRAAAPAQDESIASFVRRHFGEEVLTRLGAPLLSGVFGGDVALLSVRSVMGQFVRMEREHGSLILALKAIARERPDRKSASIFTSLRRGTGTLVDRMAEQLPAASIRRSVTVTHLTSESEQWLLTLDRGAQVRFDAVLMAVPAHVAAHLLQPLSPRAAELLTLDASSAVAVSLAFGESFTLPPGFGFLVPAGEAHSLLACTFADQKYAGRAPAGSRLLRAFFGGAEGARLLGESDEALAALALGELRHILQQLPEPAFSIVRRWPRSLPQYGVGHGERMAELDEIARGLPSLHLLGNAYRGVGLPDLIRDARAAAKALV